MRQNSTWASGLLLFNLAILSCHGAEELRRLGRANTRGGVTEESGNDSRIVGGHDAAKGRYPNMVVLYNAEGQFECGGTLILPDVVLSAAHCVSVVAQAEVGRYDISQPALLEGSMTYALVDKIAHPAYGLASTYSNDMDYALFKLSDGGLPADKFKPLTINGNPNRPHNGDVLTITGWGAVAEGGYASRILQEVQLNYLTNNQCKSFPGYEVAITEDMMCANVDGGGKVRALNLEDLLPMMKNSLVLTLVLYIYRTLAKEILEDQLILRTKQVIQHKMYWLELLVGV